MKALKIVCISCLFLFMYPLGIYGQNPCAGSPGSNTIIPSSYTICAGSSVTLNLANTYTNTGYVYQWYKNTISGVGPWSSIPLGTEPGIVSPPLYVTTYYQIAITCTNGPSTIFLTMTVTVV